MLTNRLLIPTTPFIGRAEELAEIVALLADPNCRLLTLVGPGGIGKTRLALEAAQSLTSPNGIYFVPLQALGSPDLIVSTIAETIQLQFNPGGEPRQQLLDYLRDKSLLLLLDNFEHLLEGAVLLSDILTTAPAVKLLVTSRERLNLLEEWLLALNGLSFPAGETETDLEAYGAVQLFVQCARHVQPEFILTNVRKPAVTRICQLVGGMPLGIELVAAWVRVLPCEQLADEIERSLEILATPARNMPPRHRNMRAVFAPTWERLSNAERNVFMKLSVFRGGFTRQAASQIAGTSLPILSSLVDKSLLRLNERERYVLHELLRQYGAERLIESSGEAEQTGDRHCAYYATFLENQWTHLTGNAIKAAIQEINLELDNVRAAWDWAVSHHNADAIDTMLNSLWLFYDNDYRGDEGEQVFGDAARKLKTSAPDQVSLWAKMLAREGAICFATKRDKSYALLQESVPLLRRYDARSDLAFALYRLWMVTDHDVWTSRIARLEESLALYTVLNDPWGIGQILNLMCRTYVMEGLLRDNDKMLRQAQLYGQEALALFQQSDCVNGIAMACMDLGRAAYRLGEYQSAYDYAQQSLTIFREIDIRWGLLYSFRGLGEAACGLGRYADARRINLQALQYLFDSDKPGNLWYSLLELCVTVDIWLGEGSTEAAYELLGVMDQQGQKRGIQKQSVEFYRLTLLDEDLSPALAAAVARGRAREFDTVMREVIHELAPRNEDPTTLPAPTSGQLLPNPLTARELEILRLMADGLNSREVAHRLVLSVGTVRWYMKLVYSKLDAHSRSEALAHARALNLLA